MNRTADRKRKRVGLVVDMGYHRNGISGEGFWTIIFEGAKGTEAENKSYVATFFPNDEAECRTAVLLVDDLIRGNAKGTMRGDYFHDELKALVDNYEWPHEKQERLEREGGIVNRRAAIEHTKAKG